MGWVWRDDDDYTNGYGGDDSASGRIDSRHDVSGAADGLPTLMVERSQCRTEEVEPEKFIRKCEKTEQVFKNCAGRFKLIESNTEHTEEDVTDQILNGSNHVGSWENRNNAFDFPGLQSDIDAIGRSLFGGFDRFFQAAEDMKNGFFNILDDPRSYNSNPNPNPNPPSIRQEIPVKERSQDEIQECKSGEFDVHGLAKDV